MAVSNTWVWHSRTELCTARPGNWQLLQRMTSPVREENRMGSTGPQMSAVRGVLCGGLPVPGPCALQPFLSFICALPSAGSVLPLLPLLVKSDLFFLLQLGVNHLNLFLSESWFPFPVIIALCSQLC